MTLLIGAVHALLVALLVALVRTIAVRYREDQANSARAPQESRAPAPAEAAEFKAQIHLYWAAQLLDMRLKGFDKARLAHPALRKEAQKYLIGVTDCVVDHYQLGERERLSLRENLINRYLTLPADDGLADLKITQPATRDSGDDSYKTGYAGAASWLRTRRFSSDSSLLAAVHQWGFIG